MAFIGMRHVVAAPLSAHTAGAEPTYGNGFDVGMAITGNLTINRNNNPLYADDVIAEDDNGITGMEIEVGVDDLTDEVEADMGLVQKVESGTGTAAVTTYYDTDAPAQDLGLGYMRVRRKAGVTTFQGIWIYKAKFSKNSESSQTKGESIEWQTPTVNGRCVAMAVDSSGKNKFRKRRNFDTEADAITWLDGLAGITRSSSGG